MKTRLILALLIFLPFLSKAQALKFGIMGGVSSETVKITQVPDGLTSMVKGNGIVGGEAGVFLKLKILPLYIKPEALLHFASGSVVVESADGATSDVSFNYLKAEIPVIFGLNIIGPLSIEAGPVYNYNIIMRKDFNTETIKAHPSGFGYRAGAGIDLGKSVIFDLFLQGQGNAATATEAAFHVPYSIVADLGIMF